MFDIVFLSRLQFGLTIMFHYLFPPLSIGLGLLLVIMEGLYLKTKNPVYEQMAKFWVKIFGVNFAMGTASGIVMEFQFGTNWATYSRFVGDVFGSALAAEGIFAFFLESGFLALLVFGWDKVSEKTHFFSCVMVFLGSVFSSVWIVVANSWQQTPAGYHIVGEGLKARAEITDFWAMVFNPSSMDRLGHVLIGAFIMGGFFVMSVMAYYILKNQYMDLAKKSFRMGLAVSTIFCLLSLLSGHGQAKKISVTQPAKLAAFEGVYQTQPQTPLYLFGIPDSENKTVRGLSIPGLLSFLVHGDREKPIQGLDQIQIQDHPPVGLSFQSYHLMVMLGMMMIFLTLLGCFYWWKGTLFDQKWLMKIFVGAVLAPVGANQLGWIAAEVGRQPWIVYGLLRTSESVSKTVVANQVWGSLIMFGLIYSLLLAVWIFVVDRKIKQGPDLDFHGPDTTSSHGFIEAMASGVDPAGPSLTEFREKEGQ